MINNMNLENLVERAVAINEGREPPPDENEEPSLPSKNTQSPPLIDTSEPPTPPTGEPPLELVIQHSMLESISRKLSTTQNIYDTTPHEVGNFIAIDIDGPGGLSAHALGWEEPMVIGRSHEQLVERDSITSPDELDTNAPVVLLDPGQLENNEPRRFNEKKKKYGRDPKRLYATYQEEWDRLERLGTRLASRRRSLLTVEDPNTSTSTTMEPVLEPLDSDDQSNNSKQQSLIPSTSRSRPIKTKSKTPNKSKKTKEKAESNTSLTTTELLPSSSTDDQLSIKPIHRVSASNLIIPPNLRQNEERRWSADRRRSSITPRKLSPQLFKKFGDVVIKGPTKSDDNEQL